MVGGGGGGVGVGRIGDDREIRANTHARTHAIHNRRNRGTKREKTGDCSVG